MNAQIEQVTVVGGGTAGWLAVLILHRFLNINREGSAVVFNLIESPNVPTVGVGEATIQTIASLLQLLGLNEGEFFARCNASFKLSVRFDGWALDDNGGEITFYHPFNVPQPIGGYCPAYHFHKFAKPGPGESIADAVVPNLGLIKAGKGPRPLTAQDYDRTIAYSYHLDAGLLATYLRDVAVARGVNHIRDDVLGVHHAPDGSIEALELERGGRHPVELVIDCTGFRGLLIKEALGEPFVSLGDRLLNDRAIPVQIPHRDPTTIEPCTRSSALGAGWVWRVPLYSRLGTGYVFSSAFRSDDEARREFFDYLRRIGDLPQDVPDPETRIIQMRIGHSRRFWVKNCVAIGLAAGFVEPLEATGIYMIEAAARWLAGHFPDKSFSPALANSYNRLMNELYAEVVDFIQLHYLTSNRDEPYWQAARNTPVSDWLSDMLELWKHRLPEALDTRSNSLFKYWSYIFVLQPKRFFAGTTFPLDGAIRKDQWEAFAGDLQRRNQAILPLMPSHYQLVTEMRMRANLLAEKPPQLNDRLGGTPRMTIAR
jgi:tryptophan halogenase